MSGFSFDVNDELTNMRRPNSAAKPAAAKPAEQRKAVPKAPEPAPVPPPTENPVLPEPEGFQVKQGHQETNNGSSVRTESDPVNWKKFKTLPGVFKFVGGDRPVALFDAIKRTQVSGLPEPLMLTLQDTLRERFTGAEVQFPWGSYEIDARNRVFTAKSSLLRYLMFDAYRDSEGSHVQYARQWLVLHHVNAFDANFRPEMLKQASDELDIFALLLVSHLTEGEAARPSSGEHQVADQLSMVNAKLNNVFDRLSHQDTVFEEYAGRSHMIQTVMLLDRMGLLRGGLPKDVGAFMRVLEQNRDGLDDMTGHVDNHLAAERERRRTMEREARLREMRR